MIGTQLVEELVQSVALSHCIKGYKRASLLLLAAPESGKTTVARSANCKHVAPIALLSGRSIIREIEREQPDAEFMLFNDLSAVRALSPSAVGLAILILNHYVQGETGKVGFAAKDTEEITRACGIIGCMPFKIFNDHRARWKDMGFISRMIPFAYEYGDELIAEIKDAIDEGTHLQHANTAHKMPRGGKRQVVIRMNVKLTRELRRLADARAKTLGQLGIRLLQNYHVIVRAHALLHKRPEVTKDDMAFVRSVDAFVSITKCTPLNGDV